MYSNKEFPSWAPASVILELERKVEELQSLKERFHNCEHEFETEDIDLLIKILTYEDMRSVWSKLPRYGIKPEVFSSMVMISFSYLETKPHNLTVKEYGKWLTEVKETALKLKELIQHSDYDRILEEEYYIRRQKLVIKDIIQHSLQSFRPDIDIAEHQQTELSSKSWPDLCPGRLTSVLQQLATLDSDDDVSLLTIKDKSVKLDKPNHPNARRTYFIRKLTQLIKEQTGQPLREVVTITTSVVFDNPELTERQVIRISP